MDPAKVVDGSFKQLFDKAARIIHEQENYEKAHDILGTHFNHIDNGNSRAVYEVPPKVVDGEQRLVVKFALPKHGKTGTDEALYQVEYTEGWMSNWHEIVLSNYEPLEELLVPVLDHHEDGLWHVMPYAKTLQSEEVTSQLYPLADKIEEADIKFVSHGVTSGQPEIYQINAWGEYQDNYRLRDYGGIVVSDEEYLAGLPEPLSNPQI